MPNMIKPFRVYIRNFHLTTDILDIQPGLIDEGYDAIQVKYFDWI